MTLLTTSIYGIMYAIIFIMFIVAFFYLPYLTSAWTTNYMISRKTTSSSINLFYTNVETKIEDVSSKMMTIQSKNNDMIKIIILSIIIFICFGFSFFTLFTNYKKLNKFFNIIILLCMIMIIITFHMLIYDTSSKTYQSISTIIKILTDNHLNSPDFKIPINTFATSGYIVTVISMGLMFLTVVSSFFYNN